MLKENEISLSLLLFLKYMFKLYAKERAKSDVTIIILIN